MARGGKTKGSKGRDKGLSARAVRTERDASDEESSSGDERAGQDPKAGMMPSSSSDSEDDVPRQAPTAGMMPPSSDSEGEEGGGGGEAKPEKGEVGPSAAGDAPGPEGTPQLTRKEQKALAADMERLALVRQRREDERQARIKAEGWDRFSPVSDTNKPPAGAPPAKKKDEEEEEESDDDEEEDE